MRDRNLKQRRSTIHFGWLSDWSCLQPRRATVHVMIPSVARRVLRFLIVFILLYPFGLLTHELIGHGLPGLLFGSRPTAFHMLGLDLYPKLRWVGWQGMFGSVDGTPLPAGWRRQIVHIGGSLSTTLVAAIALFLLWKRPRTGLAKLVLVSLSLWWLDLFIYTLPTWGIGQSILWGGMYAEPYEAAVALGVPGPLFQLAVLAVAVYFSLALYRILRRDGRQPAHTQQVAASQQPPCPTE